MIASLGILWLSIPTYAVMSSGSLRGSSHTSSDCLCVRWVNGYVPFALCLLTSSQSLGVDLGRLPAIKGWYNMVYLHMYAVLDVGHDSRVTHATRPIIDFSRLFNRLGRTPWVGTVIIP